MSPNRRSSDPEPAAQADPAAAASANKDGGLLRFLFGLALFAWLVRSLVAAPFMIPSGSMLPTLYIGDYLFVAKWPYGYSRFSFPWEFPSFEGRLLASLPRRGDVVVFRHPREDFDMVKRVIGLPGDRVEVRGGMLVLNGRAIVRQALPPFRMRVSPNSPCRVVPPATAMLVEAPGGPACLYPAFRETLPGGVSYTVIDQIDTAPADDFAPVRVPAGTLFLMGDNRDDSLDSRYAPEARGIGFVSQDRLVGRALVTFWSTDGSASWLKPWTWFGALRGQRVGNGYSGDPE